LQATGAVSISGADVDLDGTIDSGGATVSFFPSQAGAEITLGELADPSIQDWIAALGELITEQGAGKRRWAQVASFGVNATAVIVLMAVFAQTGGITGAEFGVAAGAAAAQQKILEQVFGSAAARSLIEDARRKLVEALEEVLRRDEQRFAEMVEAHAPGLDASGAVRRAAQDVHAAAGEFYGS